MSKSVRPARTRRPSPRVLFPFAACIAGTLASAGCASLGDEPFAAESAIVSNPPVVISQVYGAGGNSGAVYNADYVELFNRSTGPVTLDAYSIQYGSATGTGNLGVTGQITTLPAVSLQPGRYFLVQLTNPPGANGAALSADHVGSPINMSGTAGKVALVSGTTSLGCNGGSAPCNATQSDRIVDLVGFGGANFFEGSGPTAVLSTTTAAIRAGNGCTDSNSNAADFTVGAPSPRNGSTAAAPCGGSGEQAPAVASTSPANGATGVGTGTNVQVTFSEPVAVAGTWFTITCAGSPITATVTGGPTTFTLTPSASLATATSCTVTVVAANVTDLDTQDPPDAMAANHVFSFTTSAPVTGVAVHTVQGGTHLSPFATQTLTVGPAVVTAVRSTGFYMQDEAPDTNDATSEGIFVFTSSAPSVAVGNRVNVTGRISEYRPGCTPSCSASDSAFDNLTITEIDNSPTVSVLSASVALPAAIVIGSGAGERNPPSAIIDDDSTSSVETTGTFDPATDGIDFYESLEGMRIQIDNPVVVDPERTFASSGDEEIGVLARGGAGAGVRTARGGILARAGDFNPERIFITDVILGSFPTVDVGDSFSGSVIGVVDYNFANYKVVVTQPLPTLVDGGNAPETSPLVQQVVTQLTVASLNVENLDPNDPASRFQEVATTIVNRLRSPDVVALEEIQDNNGATNDGVVDASGTLNQIVSAITTAGGPTYTYRQINPVDDQDGGEPGGNIRVAFLYRTDRGLAFVDRGAPTSTLANSVDPNGGNPRLTLSPGRIQPTSSAFNSSRKPLAGEFTFRGETIFMIANHFNSKGGDDPLFGRWQPPVLSSESQRVQQATIVASFVDQIFDADADAHVVVLGDLNDFGFSPPLVALEAVGMVDLMDTLPQGERYTYVYQGNSQDLDHVMVSPSLLARSTYDIVHVNAEFAVQASDHDPAVVRLEFGEPPVIAMGSDPQPTTVGGVFTFQVSATGTPQPTFQLIEAPAGMQINGATGLVTWNPNVAPGTYTFVVQASNGVSSVSRQYTVIVNGAGAVPALPPPLMAALAALLLAMGYYAQKRQLV